MTTPEEMPVTETIELVERLDAETDVDLAAVVVNQVLPELFGRGEEEIFDRAPHRRRPRRAGRRPWPARVDAGARRRRAGRHACRRTRAEHLDPPAHGARPPACRCSTCPYLFTRAHGVRATRARSPRPLGAELGF